MNEELRKAPQAQQPAPVQEPIKPPGMAVQALAGEIIEALLADEKDGGYDLTAGLFGAAFSKLVRRWAVAEWNAPQAQQPRKAVKLSDDEIEKLQYEHVGVTKWFPNLARAIEQAVWEKLGVSE